MKRYDLEITEDYEGEYCLASDVGEEIDRLDAEIDRLKAENGWLRSTVMTAPQKMAEDAKRYRWGLEHPSLMANFFIKWKTKHDHYNHRNPGVHPSDAIDAAMEGEK